VANQATSEARRAPRKEKDMNMTEVMFGAAITFAFFVFIFHNASAYRLTQIVGYVWIPDLIMHGSVVYMFIGNGVVLIAAELAAVCMSMYMRGVRRAIGLRRLERRGWKLVWVYYTLKDWKLKVAARHARRSSV
jgi:hypothetical protein